MESTISIIGLIASALALALMVVVLRWVAYLMVASKKMTEALLGITGVLGDVLTPNGGPTSAADDAGKTTKTKKKRYRDRTLGSTF